MASNLFAGPDSPSVLSAEVTMTPKKIAEFPMPAEKKLRVKGEPFVFKTVVDKVLLYVAEQPARDGYKRVKRESKVSADDAREKLRQALIQRYHGHTEVVLTVEDRNDLIRMRRAQHEAEAEAQKRVGAEARAWAKAKSKSEPKAEPVIAFPYIKSWELGHRIYVDMASMGYTIDPYTAVMAAGKSSVLTLGQAIEEFLADIPGPLKAPMKKDNYQEKTSIRPVLDDLILTFGPDKPVVEIMKSSKELAAFLRERINLEKKNAENARSGAPSRTKATAKNARMDISSKRKASA
jgi:hypothetical protein